MPNEEWLPVVGFEETYDVSTAGRVRRRGGEFMKPWDNHNGYPTVRLTDLPRGKRATLSVHRAVAMAHVPNPQAFPIVNHIDHDRQNANAVNLEWCTQWHNLDHASKAGRMQRDYWAGRRGANAVLSDEDAAEIRRRYAAGQVSWNALGNEYGISKRSIGRIIRGESYV